MLSRVTQLYMPRCRGRAFLLVTPSPSSSSSPFCSASACVLFSLPQCSRRGLGHPRPSPGSSGHNPASLEAEENIYNLWPNDDGGEAFAVAASSAEVQQAHFGPTWSRFATIGRLSLQKMEEANHCNQNVGNYSDTNANVNINSAERETKTPTPSDVGRALYPSAEELHARELASRRAAMAQNFGSYEAYLAATLPEGDDDDREAAFEETVEEGEDTNGNTENGKSEVEEPEAMGLPDFLRPGAVPDETELLHRPTLPHPQLKKRLTTQPPNKNAPAPDRNEIEGKDAAQKEGWHTPRPGLPPAPFQAEVFAALPGRHGESGGLPSGDPLIWDTDAVLRFLELFEQPQAEGFDCSSSSSSCSNTNTKTNPTTTRLSQDASLRDAFRMAQVDGRLLLDEVTPPRLFRLMRRWHVQRVQIAREAFRRESENGAEGTGEGAGHPCGEGARAAIAELSPKLDEAVRGLDAELIQETILLSFRYAR